MRIPLTGPQVDDVLDRMLDLIPRVRTLHAELRTLEREERADGFPRSSGWDRSSPATEYDEDGTPMPPRVDPTANAVVNRAAPGYARDCLQALVVAVSNARRSLEHAECQGMKARPKDMNAPPPDPAEGIWCRWHAKNAITEPLGRRPRRGLCSFCEGFERAYGQLPPRPLLEKRATGRNVSEREIQDALRRRGAS